MRFIDYFPVARLLALLLMLFCCAQVRAEQRVLGIDIQPEQAVIHTDGPVRFNSFAMNNPPRMVVDVKGARMEDDLVQARADVGPVLRVRSAARNEHDQRIVFDLRRRLIANVSTESDPDGGARIVVDFGPQPKPVMARRHSQCQGSNSGRDFVVVLDAGHGGHDQGAVGPRGWQEKDIALAITQRLQRLIQRTPYMDGVLTRDSDEFISLQERYQIAERCQADLLVSIHADSLPGTDIHGASVYVHPSARRRGRALLASRSGHSRSNVLGAVQNVALHLGKRQEAAHALESYAAGRLMFRELAAATSMVRHSVLPGRFVVLSSDVPSILVETGYISHHREELQLADPKHQQAIAEALFRGISDYAAYFGHGPSLTDRRVHIVGARTDLIGLSQRLHWDADMVRRVNHLPGTELVAGTVLQLPLADGGT